MKRADHRRNPNDDDRAWPEGPTGPAPTTESRGDPEADDPQSGAERGAAAGAIGGAILGGVPGAVAGTVAGAAGGRTAESVDDDRARSRGNLDNPLVEPGGEGTGPTDPLLTKSPALSADPHDPGSRS